MLTDLSLFTAVMKTCIQKKMMQFLESILNKLAAMLTIAQVIDGQTYCLFLRHFPSIIEKGTYLE